MPDQFSPIIHPSVYLSIYLSLSSFSRQSLCVVMADLEFALYRLASDSKIHLPLSAEIKGVRSGQPLTFLKKIFFLGVVGRAVRIFSLVSREGTVVTVSYEGL